MAMEAVCRCCGCKLKDIDANAYKSMTLEELDNAAKTGFVDSHLVDLPQEDK
jgi:hypothetical protein